MTDLERAKITVEINRLEEEADKLENKARSDESMFADAWREYGSELAGPPQSIQINRNTAAGLRKKARFLKQVKYFNGHHQSLAYLEKMVSEIDQNIEKLNQEKVALYQKMDLCRYLSEIIN